jgi:ferredoxin
MAVLSIGSILTMWEYGCPQYWQYLLREKKVRESSILTVSLLHESLCMLCAESILTARELCPMCWQYLYCVRVCLSSVLTVSLLRESMYILFTDSILAVWVCVSSVLTVSLLRESICILCVDCIVLSLVTYQERFVTVGVLSLSVSLAWWCNFGCQSILTVRYIIQISACLYRNCIDGPHISSVLFNVHFKAGLKTK